MFSALKTKEKQSAFTLVELLVVVAVLALLASIVFSNLTGAREQAKISNALSFQSNMHNLLGADLVGWWNFDEDTGNIAKDSSGYGNDGTLKNFNFNDSSGWSNDTPSPSGYSLKFDGSNDYVDCGKGDSFDITGNQITLSAWIFPFSIADNERYYGIIGKDDPMDTNKGYEMRLRSAVSGGTGGIRSRISNNSGVDTDLSIISPQNWYHIVVTLNGSEHSVYINGKKEASVKSTSDIISTDEILRIGFAYRTSSPRYFNGFIDDVRIYNHALIATQIEYQYLAGLNNLLAQKKINKADYLKMSGTIINTQ